ncbi:MAG: aspartate aminotransferase family protein [Balneolaceae bacterium]
MADSRDKFYRHVAQTSDHPLGMEVERAEGCYIHTTDGRKYSDLISGIAVSSLGHRHPAVVEALQRQLERHLHVMVYGELIQQPQSDLAALLCGSLPDGLDRVYFVNSGTEAVEGALKLAKKATGRTKLAAFRNSYHGDTHGSLSVTGRAVYRDPYEPLLPGVRFLEFNDPDSVRQIDGSDAAVILEPVQGEGGVIPADRSWLQALRERCTETGTLLIYDEIQTGFYRTGTLFAFEHSGTVPDILCLAKAMGGGMPIGAFVSSDSIFDVFRRNPPLNHVTTFGGHPVSCAAALATLQTLLKGGFGERAARIEKTARMILQGEGIIEVRGRGAMLGLQLTDADLTRKTVEYALEKGVLLGWTLHSDSLIRIAPPLVIDQEHLESCLRIVMDGIGRAG